MVCYVGRVRAVSHSQPQTPSLRWLQMCKIGLHIFLRHNFASTAPFPDLSTPLDSLFFQFSWWYLGQNWWGKWKAILEKWYVMLEECALFPTPSPKLQAWDDCRCVKLARTSCVDLGVGSSPVELCTQKRQMLRNILGRHFSPTPLIGSILEFSDYICPQPLGLKACRGCGDIAPPVSAPTSGRDRIAHGTHLSDRLPLIQLCSIESTCKSS